MKRLIMLLALAALAVPAIASAAVPSDAAPCASTGFVRDGINLTAKKIGGNVSGTIDATGCDIGVYYGPGSVGSVTKATITNAKYFGVVNYRGKVDVKDSNISKIGNKPFDGTQHGVGIFFTTEELPNLPASGATSGLITRNVLSEYQKGGITVRGVGATAQILNNKLTGRGHLDDIAQNGIQVSFGSNASVIRNTVSGHDYTPAGTEACGLLFYLAAGDTTGATNTLSGNEINVCVVDPPVTCKATGFFRDGINLTAAKIGGNVTGRLDAAGCDIGVYYGPGSVGSVTAATITNAKYFGVVNYRGNVSVRSSNISQIGNKPFDGTQHGVGIFFTTEELPNGTTSGSATGVISGNILSDYQKGGITVRGVGATAQILDNKVTGRGDLDDIAQNGIQVSFDGNATVLRNTVSGHNYTPAGTEACGLLFYDAAGNTTGANNKVAENEQNLCVVDVPGVRCVPTGFFRDGINLTAARLGGNVTGTLDAAGCDIGVFYGPGVTGSVNAATITNAKYFGVVNYRGKVDVKNSTISLIGNKPFDGTQHGVGIFFTTEELPNGTTSGSATGVISRNVLSDYQKGGITVRGVGATAQILDNKLTGLGPVDFIAQNGIQVSYGSSAAVKRNVVSNHNYTPDGTESCGLLFYLAAGDTTGATNTLLDNELNLCVVPR